MKRSDSQATDSVTSAETYSQRSHQTTRTTSMMHHWLFIDMYVKVSIQQWRPV